MTKKSFKRLLVRRLVNKGIIGGAHKPETSFLRFAKGHPDRKEILADYDSLVKEGVIVRNKKNRDVHVSLTQKKQKWMQYLQEN